MWRSTTRERRSFSLLKTAMELYKAVGALGGGKSGTGADGGKGKGAIPSLTTGTIAAKLKARSGSTLLMAAAAHLTFVADKSTFSRQDLLSEMQSATSYYETKNELESQLADT
jgi:hypothetical protein